MFFLLSLLKHASSMPRPPFLSSDGLLRNPRPLAPIDDGRLDEPAKEKGHEVDWSPPSPQVSCLQPNMTIGVFTECDPLVFVTISDEDDEAPLGQDAGPGIAREKRSPRPAGRSDGNTDWQMPSRRRPPIIHIDWMIYVKSSPEPPCHVCNRAETTSCSVQCLAL